MAVGIDGERWQAVPGLLHDLKGLGPLKTTS